MMREEEKSVIHTLTLRPLASYASLGRTAGVSRATFASRVRDLIAKEILYKDLVKAQVSSSRVGLELVAVLLDSQPGDWTTVERACDLHPYTRYRIRCMGAVSGHFILFAIPYGAIHNLMTFLEALKDGLSGPGALTVHRVTAEPRYTETNVANYSPEERRWLTTAGLQDSGGDAKGAPLEPSRAPLLHSLNERDMLILRHLSINARTEKAMIASAVKIPTYSLSKRLKFYRTRGIVEAYRIVFNRGFRAFVSNCLFVGECPSRRLEEIAAKLRDFPFQSTFLATERGFIFHADQLPPEFYPELATSLNREATVRAAWCDYTSSYRYYFDNEPSNFSGGAWDSDREYMLDRPLGLLWDSTTLAK